MTAQFGKYLTAWFLKTEQPIFDFLLTLKKVVVQPKLHQIAQISDLLRDGSCINQNSEKLSQKAVTTCLGLARPTWARFTGEASYSGHTFSWFRSMLTLTAELVAKEVEHLQTVELSHGCRNLAWSTSGGGRWMESGEVRGLFVFNQVSLWWTEHFASTDIHAALRMS